MKGGVNVSRKEEKDYLYLIWKDPNTRRNFIVGQLSKNSQFEFSYGYEVLDAMEKGFKLLISFEDIDKIYKSDTLFPTFSSRLPDRKRRGIEKILAKYDLEEFNDYKLLKRSGARLPIDTLEFIDPILKEHNGEVKITFYIVGVRHYIGCDGKDCNKAIDLNIGDRLHLQLEPTNPYDENAIKVLDKANNHVGYIPRYYSESIVEYLNEKIEYECTVNEINKDMTCDECVKVILKMKREMEQLEKISWSNGTDNKTSVPGKAPINKHIKFMDESELLDSSKNGNSIICFCVNKLKNADEDDDSASMSVVPFQVAYAVSIHKSQGLEYNSVKIVITDEVDELITHQFYNQLSNLVVLLCQAPLTWDFMHYFTEKYGDASKQLLVDICQTFQYNGN